MSVSIPLAVCYSLLAVFLAAFLVRSIRIARLPVHLRWELAPVPKEKGKGRYGGSYLEEYEWWKQPREESLLSELVYMLEEILFLKALWAHNRRLWWFSYPFHMGLYLLTVAAVGLVLASATSALGIAGPGWGIIQTWLPIVLAVAYILGALGAAGLLVSRLVDPKLRTLTTPMALFNLALLMGVFVTGAVAVATVAAPAEQAMVFGKAIFTGSAPPAVAGILAVHIYVSLVFLAYLPFSQMMHFVAKYFTYHQVRWDDRPLEPGSAMEREVTELLGQPVTWAAHHVGSDGKKNWVDIVTQDVPR